MLISLGFLTIIFDVSGGVKNVNRESPQPFKPVIPRELAQDFARPARLDILLDMPPASRDCQVKHAWNPEDRYSTFNFECVLEMKIYFGH